MGGTEGSEEEGRGKEILSPLERVGREGARVVAGKVRIMGREKKRREGNGYDKEEKGEMFETYETEDALLMQLKSYLIGTMEDALLMQLKLPHFLLSLSFSMIKSDNPSVSVTGHRQ